MSRIALDTNVLAYAEGVNDPQRQKAALDVLQTLMNDEIVIPAQALAELFVVLTRKAGRSAANARAAVLGWRDAALVVDTSSDVLSDALDLATRHRFALWDAIMLAAAATAGCRSLLSEDMANGFAWRGVTIRNPFVSRSD